MSYIIGIDIGTTNTKAVAFTDEGEVLATAGESYHALSDPDGRHELDPARLLEAFVSALKEVTRKTADRKGLMGISLSCAMHSLIVVDKEGLPLTNAITWADLRSQSYAEALKVSEAGRRIYRQTGTPLHPMSPLSKLLWLKDKEPAIFQQAEKFISIKEYIWWRLFGKYQVDHSIASAHRPIRYLCFCLVPEIPGAGRHRGGAIVCSCPLYAYRISFDAGLTGWP